MKRTILNILLSIYLLCSSCVGEIKYGEYPGIDPNFHLYINKFIEMSHGSVNKHDFLDIEIVFKEFPSDEQGIAGSCTPTPFFRKIEINKDWWENNLNYERREELMFHELGHCVLYRSHTEPTDGGGISGFFERLMFEIGLMNKKAYLEDGCPSSYMHPTTIGRYCINKHYKYYMLELFNFN